MKHYRAVVLSPHLDDAVFSCAGAIRRLRQEGPVLVINIFTRYLATSTLKHGVPLVDSRHDEERAAAAFLDYESVNLDELDAAFRREHYAQISNIFRAVNDEDMRWLPALRERIEAVLKDIEFDTLLVPLGIGWHVDHVLTFLAMQPRWTQRGVEFYEDVPYCGIPYSASYRMRQVGSVAAGAPGTAHNGAAGDSGAWLRAIDNYRHTPIMRKLAPWIVRVMAVPAVAVYFWRLLRANQVGDAQVPALRLAPCFEAIDDGFAAKVSAMQLYTSQFKEFYHSGEECAMALRDYAATVSPGVSAERRWTLSA